MNRREWWCFFLFITWNRNKVFLPNPQVLHDVVWRRWWKDSWSLMKLWSDLLFPLFHGAVVQYRLGSGAEILLCLAKAEQKGELSCFVGGQKRRKKREYNKNTVYMLMSAPSQLSHSFHWNSTVCEDLLCVALCAHSEGIIMHSQCSIKHVVNVHNHQWQLEESI